MNGRSKAENNDSLYLSMDIILNILCKCKSLIPTIKEEVKFETLIRHLENSDERILLIVLTLMNSIYSHSNAEEKQAIAKVSVCIFFDNILYDVFVCVQIMHGKPFVAAIETAINREIHSPNQRIREQFVQIQEIIFEELRTMIVRLPTDHEVEYIMVGYIVCQFSFQICCVIFRQWTSGTR